MGRRVLIGLWLGFLALAALTVAVWLVGAAVGFWHGLEHPQP